jgi:hypothetical protein
MQAPRTHALPSLQRKLDVARLLVPAQPSRQARNEPAFLATSVVAASVAATRAAAPRQMISDMKWEGGEWMSPKELARASKCAPPDRRTKRGMSSTPGEEPQRTRKRCRAKDSDDDDDDLEDEDDFESEDEPPVPHQEDADGDPDADEEDASANTPARKRDKDRIPSKYVTRRTGPDTWVRVPRPRVFQNGKFFAYRAIPQKQMDLLQLMLDDNANPIDDAFLREHLVRRLNRNHPVSLRLVDWLVVDYACAEDVAYRRYIPSLKREVIVVVHKAYTSWLDRWRRRHFDPFRRRLRIFFDLDGYTYSTTVAQLHFFYMANIYGFLEYASQYRDAILAHMTATTAASNAAKAAAKAQGKQAPRKPLVSKAKAKAYLSEGVFRLSFGMEYASLSDESGDEGDGDDDDDGEDKDGGGDDEVTNSLFPQGF